MTNKLKYIHLFSSIFIITFLYGCGFTLFQTNEADQLVSKFRYEYQERRLASDKLVKMGDKAIPALSKGTRSDDSMVRWESVNALGYIRSPKAMPALIERVLVDDDVHTRWRSIWALSIVDDGNAKYYLQKELTNKDPRIRWNAAVALSAIVGNKEENNLAVSILHQGLKSDDLWTQWEAVNALGQLYNNETADILISSYRNSDISVRQEIILSLGKIKDKKAIPLLIESLNDKEPEIRWRSAMVLGWFGDQDIAPILRSKLDLETDDLVKENLKESLSKLGK